MKSISNAVVVVPPVNDFYFTFHRFSSIGAEIVYRIASGYVDHCSILNFPIMSKGHSTIELPSELRYLKKYLLPNETGSLSYFKQYCTFGPSIEKCAEMIIQSGADCCLISNFAYCYSRSALQIAHTVKLLNNNIVIIIGGAGVSADPTLFLNDKCIDYCLCGEAEVALPLLLRFLKGDCTICEEMIPNLGWKRNGVTMNSPLKKFTESQQIMPCIVKTLENDSSVYLSTTLSRGCRFSCEFCSNHLSHGKEFRTVSESEFTKTFDTTSDSLRLTNKVVNVNFEDDNIMHDYAYLMRIIGICKNKIDNCTFTFENGIDYRLLTKERCVELIRNGVSQFNFSLATSDMSIAGSQKRVMHIEKLESLYDVIHSHGILVITYFICGFADDTIESIVNNLIFLHNHQTISGISMFYAVPGIKGYEHGTMVSEINNTIRFAGSSAYPWNGSLSTSTMLTAFRLSRYINLVKQSKLNELEKSLIELIKREKKLFTLVKHTKKEIRVHELLWQDYELTARFFERVNE